MHAATLRMSQSSLYFSTLNNSVPIPSACATTAGQCKKYAIARSTDKTKQTRGPIHRSKTSGALPNHGFVKQRFTINTRHRSACPPPLTSETLLCYSLKGFVDSTDSQYTRTPNRSELRTLEANHVFHYSKLHIVGRVGRSTATCSQYNSPVTPVARLNIYRYETGKKTAEAATAAVAKAPATKLRQEHQHQPHQFSYASVF